MVMECIGIDVGRDHVKVVSAAGRKLKFRSKLGEARDLKIGMQGDYIVEINGEKFFVADMAEESYFPVEMATESKIHKESQVLFLTALALAATPGARVSVTTGLPVSQHTPEYKEQFKKLLCGSHTISINGREDVYTVENINIAPESGGGFWNQVLDYNGKVIDPFFVDKKVRVVDVGSRTVNYCTIVNKKYLDRDSGTLNYGVIELSNASDVLTDDVRERFSRRIVGDLSKKWLNYDHNNDWVLLIGGGSILLEGWLRNAFGLARLGNDPVFDNAAGFAKMGVVQWRTGAGK